MTRASPLLTWGSLTLAGLFFAFAWLGAEAPAPAGGSLAEAALPLYEVVEAPDRHAGRRVVARGTYARDKTIFVTGARRGRALGARVLTPLRLAEGGRDLVVLVERGWIPSGEVDTFAERDEAGEEREVYGFLRPVSFGTAQREPNPQQDRWRSLRPVALQRQLPYPLLPLILVREAGSGVELPLAPVSAPYPAKLSLLWIASLVFGVGGLAAFWWGHRRVGSGGRLGALRRTFGRLG